MGIKISKTKKKEEGGGEIKFSAEGREGALTILSNLQNSFHIPFT
jgi:hypothetical protein